LPFVFRALGKAGYQLVQRLSNRARTFETVFSWFEGLVLKTVKVEFSFEHRGCGFVWNRGETLVASRQRVKDIWVAEPVVEFTYVLLNRISEGTVSAAAGKRLKVLVEQLGCDVAETIASRLFGEKRGGRVVQACQDQCLGEILGQLKPLLVRRHLLRRPIQAVYCSLGEAKRAIHNWWQPTGLCMVLLGPDGAGKSTLLDGLSPSLGPAFRCQQMFHFRPGAAVPIDDGPSTFLNPHDEPQRNALLSVLYLGAFCVDFWVGYVLRVRPQLVRSGFVIFDRYFYDLLVDQKRYRYGGPLWLLRALLRFMPSRKNLVLILDAPEEVVLARKQQLAPEELRRQRVEYRELPSCLPNAHVVETQHGIEQARNAAAQIVVRYLAQRLLREKTSSAGLASHQVQVNSL
jgi:thymidylate kinase